MHVLAHGVDLVEVPRLANILERHGDRFLERVFTPDERLRGAGTRRHAEHLAARFAAKEATLKAIGTGWRYGIAWTDISVRTGGEGEPTLLVTGDAARHAAHRGIGGWLVSLTHTESVAMASVLALGTGPR
ncbi:MAG: holo-ACP synthase [Planctomycetota bacterium]